MRIDPAVWKLGFWIAAVRLVAEWSVVIGFRYSDWRQVAAYVLSMLILPEAFIVRNLRNEQPRWIAYLTVLVFFASYLYAWLLVRLYQKISAPGSDRGDSK